MKPTISIWLPRIVPRLLVSSSFSLLRDIAIRSHRQTNKTSRKSQLSFFVLPLQWSSGVFTLILLVVLNVILQWLPSNLLWISCPLWILLLPVCSSHPMTWNVANLSYLQRSMPSTKPSSFWLRLDSKKSRSVQTEPEVVKMWLIHQ
jgi:hypothetical protein